MNGTPERECGITYRQLDFWTRRGWLRPDHGGGSGRDRNWPAGELRVATDMGRLTRAGLIPGAAHKIARAGGTEAVLAVLTLLNGDAQ